MGLLYADITHDLMVVMVAKMVANGGGNAVQIWTAFFARTLQTCQIATKSYKNYKKCKNGVHGVQAVWTPFGHRMLLIYKEKVLKKMVSKRFHTFSKKRKNR